LRERLRSTATLAGERLRLLGTTEQEQDPRSDPDDLLDQARGLREQEAELAQEAATAQEVLQRAEQHRHALEERAADAERAVAGLLRAAADRCEGLALLEGQVAAGRSRVEAGEAEIGRLRQR